MSATTWRVTRAGVGGGTRTIRPARCSGLSHNSHDRCVVPLLPQFSPGGTASSPRLQVRPHFGEHAAAAHEHVDKVTEGMHAADVAAFRVGVNRPPAQTRNTTCVRSQPSHSQVATPSVKRHAPPSNISGGPNPR
jgi:hypothetical protein